MKAARIHAFGGPEKIAIEDVPRPKLKPKHALVRIMAAGVNPVDWMAREHIYNPKGLDRLPLTLGEDFAGIIEKIAPGSRTALREGDEVFGEAVGVFAEYAVVPVKDLVRKPKSIDFVTAASLPMSALTAWQAVVDTAKAAKNKRFLIHGAGGGVGSFAAQIAKWKGAWVAATASRPSFPYLRSIGVDRIFDYERDRFENELEDVDVVIEHLGGSTQRRSFKVLGKGGMLINLIGELDRAAAKKAGARGVLFEMKYDTHDLAQIARLVDKGVIHPHISKVLSLGQTRRALDMNEQGRSHGKLVLRVAA
jgi:NADPH:quinone reductase-like Zn-dependent oxidoreductase